MGLNVQGSGWVLSIWAMGYSPNSLEGVIWGII